jgi:hypothetical protein
MITHIRHNTLGRTPLDEGPARRRDLYLTTHNTHKRQTSMPPVGFKPTIPVSERPQTHALDRTATGIGNLLHYRCVFNKKKHGGKAAVYYSSAEKVVRHGSEDMPTNCLSPFVRVRQSKCTCLVTNNYIPSTCFHYLADNNNDSLTLY